MNFKYFSLFVLTFLCLGLGRSPGNAQTQTPQAQRARWNKVALAPITIVPRSLEGAPARADQEAVMQRLGLEATERAQRLLLKRGVGATVERVNSPNFTAPVLVTGTVTLPISLPPGVIGWRALTRKGAFATAQIVLSNRQGQVLAREEVTLDWGDVWWLHGGIRKRNTPLDEVLVKFVRKSVDRAVEQLAQTTK